MHKDIGYYIVELIGKGDERELKIGIGVNAVTGGAQAVASWEGKANGKAQFANARTTGQIRHGGFGKDTIFLALQGEAAVSFQPAMVIVEEKLTIGLTLNDSWNGSATLDLNGKTLAELEVSSVETQS